MAENKKAEMPDRSAFERPIVELEKRVAELESFSQKTGVDLSAEIAQLRQRCDEKKRDIFSTLTPWQRVQISRDPNRPDTMDYIAMLFENFTELHGDRAYRDDPSVVTGLGTLEGEKVLLVGHRKGKNTKERVACNFGCAHPEGYRKALLKMKLAEKFKLPILTLINTPGAYPGIGAEERGQAHIIAQNIFEMMRLRTPILSVIIGEGGSGGALGICVADRLLILEYAYLSVISPEGCAAILWREGSKAPLAAELLRLTPKHLTQLGVVDDIIPEPLGGAHRNPAEMAQTLKVWILGALHDLKSLPLDALLERRYEKYRRMGAFLEPRQENSAQGIPTPSLHTP